MLLQDLEDLLLVDVDVDVEFWSPKGILRNSYSLKGVMTAVLGTSCGATGTW